MYQVHGDDCDPAIGICVCVTAAQGQTVTVSREYACGEWVYCQHHNMVNHGHFRIKGTKTDIPSYLVRVGDTVSWKESDKQTDFFKERTDGIPKRPIPSWLSLNKDDMTGQVVTLPADEDLQQSINSRLIVEFYSR